MKINIDKKLCNIKIVGLHKDVHAMADRVAVELKKIDKAAVEKKEETLLAMARQWEYTDDQEKWTKFDPSINKVSSVLP